MPMMSVLPTQTKDNGERNKAVTLAGICIAISFTIASTFTNTFRGITGGSYAPWMPIYGIIAMITFWALFKTSHDVFGISLLYDVLYLQVGSDWSLYGYNIHRGTSFYDGVYAIGTEIIQIRA